MHICHPTHVLNRQMQASKYTCQHIDKDTQAYLHSTHTIAHTQAHTNTAPTPLRELAARQASLSAGCAQPFTGSN